MSAYDVVERRAERIEIGLLQQIDHERFYVTVVTSEARS